MAAYACKARSRAHGTGVAISCSPCRAILKR